MMRLVNVIRILFSKYCAARIAHQSNYNIPFSHIILDQGKLIHKLDWDILIILDACRYDIFEKYYNMFFEGTLGVAISRGSHTLEWLHNTFSQTKILDLIYISANPFINSITKVNGFNPKEHFLKIIDAWLHGWDESLGTVPPWNVNKIFIKTIEKYPDKRIIIHYLQPHAPYIVLAGMERLVTSADMLFVIKSKHHSRFMNTINKVMNYLVFGFAELISYEKLFQLRKAMRLVPYSQFEASWRLTSSRRKHHIKLLYEANLLLVLFYAMKLIDMVKSSYPNKKIVITADHGELLGEAGYYEHIPGILVPQLRLVPWFEVKTIRKTKHFHKINILHRMYLRNRVRIIKYKLKLGKAK